ncbi:acyl-CoA-binding protein [Plasmodium brasilianum]|uniref:Acyl-CoA-binding protein n=1 Tax=Plasmodium brasilianum TaxID=5824 RepID=A0ACB9YA82_PLABR|nr:acyl-CoA-binding protein [Plasmodium brasilianum]
MFKNINKSFLFVNVTFAMVILCLLKGYNKNTSIILNKLYYIKTWLLNVPLAIYRKYRRIDLPVIDKSIIVNVSDEELEEKFCQICNAVKMYRSKLKFEEWVYLYGLYKQIKEGDVKLINDTNEKCSQWCSNSGDASGKGDSSGSDHTNGNLHGGRYHCNSGNRKGEKLEESKNGEFVKSAKMRAWKNCYGVNKKVCKFLYVEFFTKLFPNALENLNNNFTFDITKSISKMKPLKDNNYDQEDCMNNNSSNLCDIFCQGVVEENIEQIKNTLKNHPSLINKKNTSGLTALHYACDRGYLDIVKFLVDQGADIHAEDSFGDTALHIAAYSEKREIIEYLISAGADANRKNLDGMSITSILSHN